MSSFNLSFYDSYLERLWAIKTINGKKKSIRCFLMFQFINDAVYDWSDYITENPPKMQRQTIYRIIINLLSGLAYYYIYRKNKELIEQSRSLKQSNRIKSQAKNSEDLDAEINAYIHKTTPILYTYYNMVVLFTLYNITKEIF